MAGSRFGRCGAFEDLRHRGLGDFHFGVRRTERNRVVLHRDDDADDAARRDDFVSRLERFEQFLLLLGTLLLRADHHEIQHHNHQPE